jgi:CBS domain-containing protein
MRTTTFGDPDPVATAFIQTEATGAHMATARELMTSDATCVVENQTIDDAARMMSELGSAHCRSAARTTA